MTEWNSLVGLETFRLSKWYTNSLFDGQLHLVQRGVHYPAVMADSDMSQRLRNAASYRKVKVALTYTPEGILIQSYGAGQVPSGRDEQLLDLVQQLSEALDRNSSLEKVLQEVPRLMEIQVQDFTRRLNDLEAELLVQKEELSVLKMRQ